ncbi:non-reducing end alpha-L-arabinofuranosidase family hydrolase [Pseudoduganella sp. SL102]|uniref:non-reducing end alpha-L-arabinofuranosidase family hydrolase n=1 Tax=Pseudoduganella sp. SL102 TaxID=2995154 RepID=UPI00248C97C7|nr:non-reducing end alpha-L-arabinofuranosidase family hydrolase [Pseudoduganella sp. SL102]WBS00022.1 non-reducing end alpha-L-arabinofuranosidase family hydrolase [Pseudoduganella sp. SL102]
MNRAGCGIGGTVWVALAICGWGGKQALANSPAEPAVSPAKPAFNWTSTPPLIAPRPDPGQTIHGVKDPSIVFADGKYHVFLTTAGSAGWGLAYTSFEKWSDAPAAKIIPLDKSPMGPGYRAAPQVFYFAPQKTWYLVYQGADPLYSTSEDIGDPLSWSAPKKFFPVEPDIVKPPQGVGWLDFWVICDDSKCYMFATDDNGRLLRSETELANFPNGFHNTVAVMTGKKEDVFEASNTYRVARTDTYITLVEAISPQGRYFRIWKSDRLDGKWEPFSSAPMNGFATRDNVERIWSEGISHGELVRTNTDQTMTIDPCRPLEYLFQGNDPTVRVDDYVKIPYRLGVITAKGENPVSALCR